MSTSDDKSRDDLIALLTDQADSHANRGDNGWALTCRQAAAMLAQSAEREVTAGGWLDKPASVQDVKVIGLIRKGEVMDGQPWYAITCDEVPGLYLAGTSLPKLLAGILPAWRKLHDVAPDQVPDPGSIPNREPDDEAPEPSVPETPGTWEERCAVLYQVIGTLSWHSGIFETSDDVANALDVACGRGDVEKLLPWPKDITFGKPAPSSEGTGTDAAPPEICLDMVPRSRYDACNTDWLAAKAEVASKQKLLTFVGQLLGKYSTTEEVIKAMSDDAMRRVQR